MEEDEHFERLAGLPGVAGLAPLSRLVLPETLESDYDLRVAAGRLKAPMLLLYTFDTAVDWQDSTSPLDVVTLGFLPHHRVRVHSTVSAVLLDTRSGYLYAAAEADDSVSRLANSWTRGLAADGARRKAEARAFDELVDGIVGGWPELVGRYHGAASAGDAGTVAASRSPM